MEERKKGTIWDQELGLEERLDWLIGELTLEEKLHMLSSGSSGIARLGIPDCRLGGEAAHGVEARNDQFRVDVPDITTSFPQPIGMSSSWDVEAIRAAGEIVGKEARIIYRKRPGGGISRWAPTVDLLRDPRWGRNEEAYGEDPVQVGAMASAYVRGIQTDDGKGRLTCASTLKHFYANNTEIGRGWKNASMSPRDKYEYYLEPFRRCIEDGKVEGVMTAYNRINGTLGLFNEEVKYLLKDEFGLSHAVSDGGAMELAASYSHATAMDAETVARSIKAGVDALSGRPDGVYAGALEAFELGLLTEDDVNEAIRNVYKTKIRLGLFDEDADQEDLGELCSETARKVCKKLTDQSLVLLKNDGALPLQEESLSEAALIGPVGDKWYMDWYAGEAPEHVSLLDGLKEHMKKAGQGKLSFADGCDRIRLKCGERFLAADQEGRYRLSEDPDEFVLEDWGEGSYTFRDERTGKYVVTNLADDLIVDADNAGATAEGADGPRLTGKVCVGKERIFSWFDLEVFRMEARDCDDEWDGMEADGEMILRDRFGNHLFMDRDGFVVSAREAYGILKPLYFTVQVIRDGMKEAKEVAAKAGTVIMALGHNPMVNAKEEIDRATIEFIPRQQRLFDEIRQVNPNVIVVLMSDYPFAINGIEENARAILWSATGSQCMGRSLADALIGKVSPAGRLTQTWYGADEDLPDIDDYDVIGKGRTYRYFEGKALYPFGFGLTYANFAYDGLKLSVVHEKKDMRGGSRRKAFGQPNGVYDKVRRDVRVLKVELTVKNTGEYPSDEVVQIYAKAPEGGVKRPIKQLIGFDRFKEIAPGEKRCVQLSIPIRELAFYDVIGEELLVEAGEYEITAAPSSDAQGLSQTLWIEGEKRGVRDLSKRIKADHFDEECGSQIVEGLYGFHAIAAQGPSTYEPKREGRFSATYAGSVFPENAKVLRIHGSARENATIRIVADETCVGELTLNTRDYDKRSAPARNHVPRAEEDERRRKASFPLLWADVFVPLDLAGLKEESQGHVLRIEVTGPFQYDWFMAQ